MGFTGLRWTFNFNGKICILQNGHSVDPTQSPSAHLTLITITIQIQAPTSH